MYEEVSHASNCRNYCCHYCHCVSGLTFYWIYDFTGAIHATGELCDWGKINNERKHQSMGNRWLFYYWLLLYGLPELLGSIQLQVIRLSHRSGNRLACGHVSICRQVYWWRFNTTHHWCIGIAFQIIHYSDWFYICISGRSSC